MSRIYEEFCELMSAYNEANDKWTPIQKAHELLGSVNEDEIWEQRNAAANALYKYIAELTTRIAELEAERDQAKAAITRLRDYLYDYTNLHISVRQEDRWWALVDKFDELTKELQS